MVRSVSANTLRWRWTKTKYPRISYYDAYNGALKYAYYSGSFWAGATIDRPSAAQSADVEVDLNPELGAAADQPAWRNPILQSDAEDSFLSANEANASLDPGVGLYTSIAVDGNDYVHISYYDAINKDLKYATNASGQWVTSVVNSKGTVGKYTSIDVEFQQ